MEPIRIQVRYPSGVCIRTVIAWYRPAPDPRQGDVLWFYELDQSVTVIDYGPETGVIIACPTRYVAQA
jgi:hypothetical protein